MRLTPVPEHAMKKTPVRPKRIRSFGFAFRGILTMLATQTNARIHAALTVIAAGLSVLFRLSPDEWTRIIIAIVIVWIAEALNTAFEFLADVTSPGFHPLVEKAKDVAAGSVLIAAIGAALIGVLTFWPHIARMFG
jgi:diacylglycerol kinase (ATP)